jgi:hypothetical protein
MENLEGTGRKEKERQTTLMILTELLNICIHFGVVSELRFVFQQKTLHHTF